MGDTLITVVLQYKPIFDNVLEQLDNISLRSLSVTSQLANTVTSSVLLERREDWLDDLPPLTAGIYRAFQQLIA
jgi:hypothetical protein